MVKKIIHIADIHIPNEQKHKPFEQLIKRLVADIVKEIQDDDKSEIRIVISGDIFHHKIKVTNEAQSMFHELLNLLNIVGKTIIIAGNHDMLENNTDRKDSISPTFEIRNVYPNIIFADKELDYKSGYIVDDNITWVLYSMFDKFAKPYIEQVKKDYPNNKIIGLYHGDVVGAVTDTGHMSADGIDTNLFKECDCVMAGHIHKYQTIKKNGVPIVYAGSAFQHNAGENVSGHGFVVWNIETLKYKLHEVYNPYSIYRFEVNDYADIDNDAEILLNL